MSDSRHARLCRCVDCEKRRDAWQEHYRRRDAEFDEHERRTGRNLFLDRLSKGTNE